MSLETTQHDALASGDQPALHLLLAGILASNALPSRAGQLGPGSVKVSISCLLPWPAASAATPCADHPSVASLTWNPGRHQNLLVAELHVHIWHKDAVQPCHLLLEDCAVDGFPLIVQLVKESAGPLIYKGCPV